MDGRRTPGGALRRTAWGAAYLAFTALVALGDMLRPDWRFGYFRTATKIAFRSRTVPAVTGPRPPAAVRGPGSAGPGADGTPPGQRPAQPQADIRCVLVTGSLDVGGVEAVVGLLARELPVVGVSTTVVCRWGGRMADELRGDGVTVLQAGSDAEAAALVADLQPDVVQVHNAPTGLVSALLDVPVPTVPVIHNIELYRTPAAWAVESELALVAPFAVAVSDAVRRHHLEHIAAQADTPVRVIPNGAPPSVTAGAPGRREARELVGAALDIELGEDFLVVCLARYSAQKNLPGLVAAFLDALEQAPELRLVVAGEPEDWLELRRADSLRLSHRAADRIHLVGNSHAPTLLAAADGFTLDSYFEGWPVAATEAAALGIPLVMSDVGGARELIGGDRARGVLVANPCGPHVTLAAVGAARRALRQGNRAEVAAAFVALARDGVPRRPAGESVYLHRDMVLAHAEALRAAARTGAAATSTAAAR